MELAQALARLRAAEGDADALTLAAVDILLDPHPVALRVALEAAAIPHWFDARILAELLGLDRNVAVALVAELVKLTVVEEFSMHQAWNVHEATRLVLRRKLAEADPARFSVLSRRAAHAFPGGAAAQQVETIYHRLVIAPKLAARQLHRLWKAWSSARDSESLQALGFALEELLRTKQLMPPAHARSLLSLSRIRRSTLSLLQQQALVVKAMDLFRSLNDKSSEAESHNELGHVLREGGDLFGALEEYRMGATQFRSLAHHAPKNVDAQLGLAESNDFIGILLQARNDHVEAIEAYETSRTIKQGLVRRAPQSLAWQRALAASHQCVGSVLLEQGELVAAAREYEAGKSLLQRLTELEPDRLGWQHGLASAHTCLGAVHRRQAELVLACSEYRAAKEILLELTAREPYEAEWRRDLAVVHHALAALLEEQGDLPQALDECQAAKSILLELAGHGRGQLASCRELAIVRYLLGSILEESDLAMAASDEYRAAKDLLQDMKEMDPKETEWQPALSLWPERVTADEEGDAEGDGALVEFETDVTSTPSPVAGDPEQIEPEPDVH